ncbi:hypothetical protein D3C73_1345730 [compost metagenome]
MAARSAPALAPVEAASAVPVLGVSVTMLGKSVVVFVDAFHNSIVLSVEWFAKGVSAIVNDISVTIGTSRGFLKHDGGWQLP